MRNKADKGVKPKKWPKNTYDWVLSPQETLWAVSHGWNVIYNTVCEHCRCRGCSKCYYRGMYMCLQDKNNKKTITGVPYKPLTTGATMSARMSYSGDYYITARGPGGDVDLSLTPAQAISMLRSLTGILDRQNTRDVGLDLTVEAKFCGPPTIMSSGMLGGRNRNAPLTERMMEAVSCLMGAGFQEEAKLLSHAFNHECFLIDMGKRDKERAKIGELPVGTIIERKGTTAVITSEDGIEKVVNVKEDKTLLSCLTS